MSKPDPKYAARHALDRISRDDKQSLVTHVRQMSGCDVRTALNALKNIQNEKNCD